MFNLPKLFPGRGTNAAFRRHHRLLVTLIAVLAAAFFALATDGRIELLDGTLYDLAVALRATPTERDTRVAVIAVDRESLAAPALANIPRPLFGPQYATLIEALANAGAVAIGVDVVLNYAASRLPALDPTYDAPLLKALAQHRDRIVIARTAATGVADPYLAVLFDPTTAKPGDDPPAVAYAELVSSGDGVQRWVYPALSTREGSLPTLAGRLAAIAGRPATGTPFMLAPRAPLERIPTFRFSDVLACAERDPEVLRRAFAGRVVLIGGDLPEEDRMRASDRFIRWPRVPPLTYASPGCSLEALGPSDPDADAIPGLHVHTVPGLHVHAAATSAILSGAGIQPISRSGSTMVTAGAAALAAGFSAAVTPVATGFIAIVLVIGLFAASITAMSSGYWLPVAVPALATIVAAVGAQATRFLVFEGRRRRVERAFGHYLAPALVERLAEDESGLSLGGELRDITVMFADLTGFTALSTTIDAALLTQATNRYFEAIVQAVDDAAGYVDKFVGDAVMALWGAPFLDPDHAPRAVACAAAVHARVRELAEQDLRTGSVAFTVKISIATGPAVVGNVGAHRRLSYTALGATVNLAARLEKVCSDYGCPTVLDETTVQKQAGHVLCCEIDDVLLRGMRAPVPVYIPIATTAEATEAARRAVERYGVALAELRAGRPEAAATIFDEIGASDAHPALATVARTMAVRARGSAVAL